MLWFLQCKQSKLTISWDILIYNDYFSYMSFAYFSFHFIKFVYNFLNYCIQTKVSVYRITSRLHRDLTTLIFRQIKLRRKSTFLKNRKLITFPRIRDVYVKCCEHSLGNWLKPHMKNQSTSPQNHKYLPFSCPRIRNHLGNRVNPKFMQHTK